MRALRQEIRKGEGGWRNACTNLYIIRGNEEEVKGKRGAEGGRHECQYLHKGGGGGKTKKNVSLFNPKKK